MAEVSALAPLGLRERKKLRTRAELADAAMRLFAERGFDSVTVEEIADAVEVSPRTFFRYFDTKEDVLTLDSGVNLTQIVDRFAARPADESPFVALRHAFADVAASYEADRARLVTRAQIIARSPSLRARTVEANASWESALTVAVAARLGIDDPGDMRPRLVAVAAIAAVRVSLDSWLADATNPSLGEHISEAFHLLDGGAARLVTIAPTAGAEGRANVIG